jgi:hypothetical protein
VELEDGDVSGGQGDFGLAILPTDGAVVDQLAARGGAVGFEGDLRGLGLVAAVEDGQVLLAETLDVVAIQRLRPHQSWLTGGNAAAKWSGPSPVCILDALRL